MSESVIQPQRRTQQFPTWDSSLDRYSSWTPDAVAVTDTETTRTYAELQVRVNRLCNALTDQGVTKGSRVAVLLGNAVETFEVFFALARLGVVRVPLNHLDHPHEQLYKIEYAECSLVILDEESVDQLTSAAASVPGTKLPRLLAVARHHDESSEYEQLIGAAPDTRPEVELFREDILRLGWTGGTTGRSKAVLRSLGAEIGVVRNLLTDVVDPRPGSTLLHTLPVSHASGLLSVAYFARGASNVVRRKFDVDDFLSVVHDWKISDTMLVPTALYRLLAARESIDIDQLSSLTTIVYGAAPMSQNRLAELLDWLGPRFIQTFALAEATLACTVLSKRDHQNPDLLGSCGRACTAVDVAIIDDDGQRVPIGEPGHIGIRSDHVMNGYLGREKETAEAFAGGWLKTSDIARMDDNGYVYILDRKNDVIVSGGFNIYPAEIENAFHGSELVKDIAVFGVEDADWGEAIWAAVVPSDHGGEILAGSVEPLLDHLRQTLPSYKLPKRIVVWHEESLPRSAVGKTLRSKVREVIIERDADAMVSANGKAVVS